MVRMTAPVGNVGAAVAGSGSAAATALMPSAVNASRRVQRPVESCDMSATPVHSRVSRRVGLAEYNPCYIRKPVTDWHTEPRAVEPCRWSFKPPAFWPQDDLVAAGGD